MPVTRNTPYQRITPAGEDHLCLTRLLRLHKKRPERGVHLLLLLPIGDTSTTIKTPVNGFLDSHALSIIGVILEDGLSFGGVNSNKKLDLPAA
ncbi:hypothetical protein PSFL6913_20150 [Pseudomonas fluorescens]|uniref:Uncharacterized protein n=1 Tax=Pseudomonas fluorescens TaxID=294 RepID=A0A8B4IBM5_PSEFL|nr:Uncharacterised protein [Pseudomonas fluorescens]